MRSLKHFLSLAIWCTCFTIIQRTETFLFRRKVFNQLTNDPYQVKPETITKDNLFKWMNLKHHIRFKLWTRDNPKWAHEIKIGDLQSLRTSNYDFRRLTKILVHGWAHSANEVYIEDWIFSMRDSFLRLADLNILIIDYTVFALPHMYWTAGPILAGKQLGEMINFLVENGAELDHFHMLGYSWGAHVAGIAGHRLEGKVSRITGLDPANPTFRLGDNIHRLDSSDAQYVDIIHTGGGPFVSAHLGLLEPLGHADFYPNGGTDQPGCARHWQMLDESIECDHGRSVWYYVESINSPYAFFSCPCDSWDRYVKGNCECSQQNMTLMGEHSSHSTRGIYYLFTRAKSPFGLGPQMNISLQSMDDYDPHWNTLTDVNHRFTPTSARNYLSGIVQKSLHKLPVIRSVLTIKSDKDIAVPNFKSKLLSNAKVDRKFQDTVVREIRQAEVLARRKHSA